MKRVKYFGLEKHFSGTGFMEWRRNRQYMVKIWHRLYHYLCTEVNSTRIGCIEKIQKGERSSRNCYNNIQENKLFEGDRDHQRH